jgi:hypothetical protein
MSAWMIPASRHTARTMTVAMASGDALGSQRDAWRTTSRITLLVHCLSTGSGAIKFLLLEGATIRRAFAHQVKYLRLT